jgi:hypothetical protein
MSSPERSAASVAGATARGRTYRRKFDHDDARRRFAEGETAQELAARYGVTTNAVRHALDPDRARRWHTTAQANFRAKLACADCGKGMTHRTTRAPDGRVLCVACRGKARRTRFVEVAGEIHARCHSCHEVKPLSEYPAGSSFKDVRPNGVHGTCRTCQTEDRRRWRREHAEHQRVYDRERKRRLARQEVAA